MKPSKHYYKQGSNQYKLRPQHPWYEPLVLFFAFLFGLWAFIQLIKLLAPDHIISPVPEPKNYPCLFIGPVRPGDKVCGKELFKIHDVEAAESGKLRALTPEEEQDWEAMKRMAQKLAPLYDFPVKVVVAQTALESARGTSHYCVTRNNCWGIAAYDYNPDAAWRFETKEQGYIEYFRLIRDEYPDCWALRHDPEAMIQCIWESGYATDPYYVAKVKSMPEWRAL